MGRFYDLLFGFGRKVGFLELLDLRRDVDGGSKLVF